MKIKFNTPQSVANEQNGLTVRYAAAKRQLPRLRWYLLLLLVCAPLVYMAARILLGVVWEASPGFVSMPQSTLKAGLNGRLELLVHEGDVVSAGAVVARVYPYVADTPPPVPAGLSPVLRQLDDEAGRGRFGQSGAMLGLMQEQRARMAQRLAVVNRLMGEGAATLAERSQAEAQLAAAQGDLLRAQADVYLAESSLRRVRQDGMVMPAPQTALAAPFSDVVAPAAGTVVRTFAINQDWVAMGTELLLLQRQDQPEIRVFINPNAEHNARVGARADLRFMDGDRMEATVVKIEAEAARTPPERVGPLASRMQSIVAVLKPDQPLPAKYRIGDLPMDVRFHRVWF